MIKNYIALTKPGIIFGNIVTCVGGFALASKGYFDFWLFLATLVGISLIIASACVFNNFIDRDIDEKMQRTKNRPLVIGAIDVRPALHFGSCLLLLGTLVLTIGTNLLALYIALAGFFVYVMLYSIMKPRSEFGTLIGSWAGACPPVVGYCAVSHSLDFGALLLFLIVALWQMPHFYAIAMYRVEEYAAASIPVLPVKRGMYNTKVQMLLYTAAFMVAALMLPVFGYMGLTYLVVATLLGSGWLWHCLQGFSTADDIAWARKNFFCSLAVVTILCLTISIDAFLL
jgi:heme o synthase